MLPNCTATFFLFSTTRLHGAEQPTNPMTATNGCCCCFFFSNRKQIFLNIIIHLLHSHIHCDLDHSCSKLTLHDLHFFPHVAKIFPTMREIFTINTAGNTANFKSTRRRGGSHVTWEVEGHFYS